PCTFRGRAHAWRGGKSNEVHTMRRWFLSIAVAAGLLPGLAFADTYAVSKPAPPQPLTAELNGGIGEFTGTVGDRTNLGPAYGATLGYSLLPQAQVELGYQGFS